MYPVKNKKSIGFIGFIVFISFIYYIVFSISILISAL